MAARNAAPPSAPTMFARTGAVAAPADDIQQQQGDFDGAVRADRTRHQRAGAVAGNADANCGLAVGAFGGQPQVGGKAVQIQRTAAVDDDGQLGRKPSRKQGPGQRLAQCVARVRSRPEALAASSPASALVKYRHARRPRRCRFRDGAAKRTAEVA